MLLEKQLYSLTINDLLKTQAIITKILYQKINNNEPETTETPDEKNIINKEQIRQREKKIYKCEHCNKEFRDSYILKRHNNSKRHIEKINKIEKEIPNKPENSQETIQNIIIETKDKEEKQLETIQTTLPQIEIIEKELNGEDSQYEESCDEIQQIENNNIENDNNIEETPIQIIEKEDTYDEESDYEDTDYEENEKYAICELYQDYGICSNEIDIYNKEVIKDNLCSCCSMYLRDKHSYNRHINTHKHINKVCDYILEKTRVIYKGFKFLYAHELDYLDREERTKYLDNQEYYRNLKREEQKNKKNKNK